MINETLIHCRGVGPATEKRLREAGYKTWQDCIERPEELPLGAAKKKLFLDDIEDSIGALEREDIVYLVETFPNKEHWKILDAWFEEAMFFDIETTDIFWQNSLTSVVVTFHKGELKNYVYGENLDDFLESLNDVNILVSFNGNSFDIPFLEKTFNIPEIPCPHVDMRWISYHRGYSGGLKQIEKELEISRPEEISEVDGLEAVRLFYDWQDGNDLARDRLISYCRADVIATYLLAVKMLEQSSSRSISYSVENLYAMI